MIDSVLNRAASTSIVAGIAVFAFALLGFAGAPLALWTVAIAAALLALGAPLWLWIVFCVLAVVFDVKLFRRVLSLGVMHAFRALHFLPEISATEREAIEAGDVWIERELFSVRPDFERILAEPYAGLSAEEQEFLDGPRQAGHAAGALPSHRSGRTRSRHRAR